MSIWRVGNAKKYTENKYMNEFEAKSYSRTKILNHPHYHELHNVKHISIASAANFKCKNPVFDFKQTSVTGFHGCCSRVTAVFV